MAPRSTLKPIEASSSKDIIPAAKGNKLKNNEGLLGNDGFYARQRTITTVKLVKMFVERGKAGIHIEDQAFVTKKCGHIGDKITVTFNSC